MNTQPSSSAARIAHFQFASVTKKVRDYDLSYSILDISIQGSLQILFPRTGYLICSFVTGTNFECRFLNYNLSVSRPHHLYISGLYSEGALVMNQSGKGGGQALKIHPVVGYHFLRTPMHLLTNKQLLLSQVLNRNTLMIRALEADLQIYSLDDPYLVQWLEKVLPDKSTYLNDPIYHAVNTIIRKKGKVRVQELAKEFSMSVRTLHRQFLLKVGLSPQAYAKIWKLEHVIELLQRNPKESLEQIAFSAGYYDAAHLAHDFKNNLPCSPTKFNEKLNNLTQNYLNHPNSLI